MFVACQGDLGRLFWGRDVSGELLECGGGEGILGDISYKMSLVHFAFSPVCRGENGQLCGPRQLHDMAAVLGHEGGSGHAPEVQSSGS
jgi:hypothetical protein